MTAGCRTRLTWRHAEGVDMETVFPRGYVGERHIDQQNTLGDLCEADGPRHRPCALPRGDVGDSDRLHRETGGVGGVHGDEPAFRPTLEQKLPLPR
eukprot:CAMPEP_0175848292 /NCGR_PEP_ID=MMETSP0107_2-20121207/23843_1 /TAXON_ID=195067 ORGANISM="Goniomonas pacifica, Strain CCMP1869" /NCGR_SAMPLE_ID=MMETSP0107_2 /ASSEMBLY_ACC=CAM_ASM_000203 /LENGTH=95 /DNA_ID=CAMNT_0017163233 /DNA_START=77 /DNA_END=360 /DNA_ORIENTATION=-